MAAPLLATRLYIPQLRKGHVPRPRLLESLRSCMDRPVVLISAPAGYGKTALAAEFVRWLQAPPARTQYRAGCAWCSLDADDSDPFSFWYHIIGALQAAEPGSGRFDDARALLESGAPAPIRQAVTALLNDLVAADQPFVLILDDYHLIQSQAVDETLAFLVDHLPPLAGSDGRWRGLRLLLLTRMDPALPLARWRARGLLGEVRARDLRFSAEETSAFLNGALHFRLADGSMEVLAERTEGWIAGLQLAAPSLQGRQPCDVARFIDGFSGRHEFVLDYLGDEVLAQQPPDVRRLLLSTSVLDRFCAPLAAVLLAGEEPAPRIAARLASLLRANVFLVPLDDDHCWYRYHHLFADLLRARLSEEEPECVPELHRRAAAWFAGNDLTADAVRHALAAEDAELAADLLERAVRRATTWSSGDVAALLRWMRVLPTGVIRRHAWLYLYRARALNISGQFALAEVATREVEEDLAAIPDSPEKTHLLATAHGTRARIAAIRGDIGEALRLGNSSLDGLSKGAALERYAALGAVAMAHYYSGRLEEAAAGYAETMATALSINHRFAAVTAACDLARVHMAAGDLIQAGDTCRQALDYGTVAGMRVPAAGLAELVMGLVHLERNELADAERHLQEGLALVESGGISDAFGEGHLASALVRAHMGQRELALADLHEGLRRATDNGMARSLSLADAYQARARLALKDYDHAAAWAGSYCQGAPAEYLREFADQTLANVLLATDRPEEALRVLAALIPPAEAGRRWGAAAAGLAAQAAACAMLGRQDEAVAGLERALQLTMRQGHVRLYLDCGQPLHALLVARARRTPRDAAGAYAARVAGQFPGRREATAAAALPLAEPLTDREGEVLRLLAAGLTNREIAERLVLSPNTLKVHVANLFGKLAVHTRLQAVLRGRELGLLPPGSAVGDSSHLL